MDACKKSSFFEIQPALVKLQLHGSDATNEPLEDDGFVAHQSPGLGFPSVGWRGGNFDGNTQAVHQEKCTKCHQDPAARYMNSSVLGIGWQQLPVDACITNC